jgi:hypothetical protein
LLLALALPLVGLAVAGARSTGPAGGALLAVSAGLGFGGVGVAARVWVAPDPVWRVVLDPVSLALAVYAVIALVCFGLALQRGSVTTAAAITFTVETVVPAAVGLVWLGDRIRPGLAGLAAAGFLLTLGGCVALARYAGEPD